MSKNKIYFGGIITAFFVALSACTKSSDKSSLPLIADAQNIISTRPQNANQFMAVVKLQTAPLLTTSTVVNGVRSIDQAQAKKLEEEQIQAIDAMKKLSSDVQVLFRYKMVLNAVAVLGPKEVFEKLATIGAIASWEKVGTFGRPENVKTSGNGSGHVTAQLLSQRNSLKFVGAEKLHQAGITGKGMKVGVLDTGIDYTHAMFKGTGTVDAYKAIDPAKEAVGFPSEKVVGGIDLVGTHYDSGSPNYEDHIPHPDLNPLDEGGHGSHVAGTIAGLGDGGLESYDGMAKDASLYAIKVFGAEGSTSDMVVIAGLEYSADPNGDGDLRDQLDIVNLSLGSGYGNPHILYTEAVKNLVEGGTVAVISAGNSGDKDYIVGSPGTATEALSVAASIDDGDHNWNFDASEAQLPQEKIVVEAMEAATTKSIHDGPVVSGEFYYIGLADKDLTAEQNAALKGKIALIDRGAVNFNDKLARAASGDAIGAVVINNRPNDAAFRMGTTTQFNFPAIMITQAVGQKIKAALGLTTGGTVDYTAVKFSFLSSEQIHKPELIDQITSFSSKGPRSVDGYLKPEISAPGSDIISAKMGGGAQVVKMSGTSMAAPHMAGIMALIKQSMQQRGLTLSAPELKNVAMGTSKTIGDTKGRYPVSRQGAGRVQADVAAAAVVVANQPSISFGEINIESKKSMRSRVELKSLSTQDMNLKVVFEGNEFIQMRAANNLSLKAGGVASATFTFDLDATKMKDESSREMDGWVKFYSGQQEVYRIPVLAVAHRMSAIMATDLQVLSSQRDALGAAATLTLTNANDNQGEALLFNLLGLDERKPQATQAMNADCDLQAVGYKIVQKKNEKGVVEDVIQFGIKTYKPMTTWNSCDVSILIDSDGDGKPEQELLGANLKTIPGQKTEDFASTLLDAKLAREIRQAFEASIDQTKAQYANDPKKLSEAIQKLKDKENYDQAILDMRAMKVYNDSTVVVVEAAVSALALNAEGSVAFKIVVSHNEQSSVQADDVLASANGSLYTVSVNSRQQAFADLDEVLSLAGQETRQVELTKGDVFGDILALYPQNKFTFFDNVLDAQAQVVKPTYAHSK